MEGEGGAANLQGILEGIAKVVMSSSTSYQVPR